MLNNWTYACCIFAKQCTYFIVLCILFFILLSAYWATRGQTFFLGINKVNQSVNPTTNSKNNLTFCQRSRSANLVWPSKENLYMLWGDKVLIASSPNPVNLHSADYCHRFIRKQMSQISRDQLKLSLCYQKHWKSGQKIIDKMTCIFLRGWNCFWWNLFFKLETLSCQMWQVIYYKPKPTYVYNFVMKISFNFLIHQFCLSITA